MQLLFEEISLESASDDIRSGESSHPMLLPEGTTPIQVIELVEDLSEIEVSTTVHRGCASGSYRKSSQIQTVEAAERLGFVTRTNGRVVLTDLGLGFSKASSDPRMGILRSRLSRTEPFKTALDLLTKKKSVRAKDILKVFERSRKSFFPINKPEERSIQSLLIEWGIFSDLLHYDRKGACFRPDK